MNAATRLMVAKLADLAERGMTYTEAAQEAEISYHLVASYARRFDLEFRQEKRGRKISTRKDERSADMRLMYEEGNTLIQIGQKYGITRERVRQILTRDYGTRAKDGGKAETGRRKRREFHKKRDARCLKYWGCTYRQYRSVLKMEGKPTRCWHAQRQNAAKRSIAWELNLWQWWKLWQQSGHWSERGRGNGYCMCRLNDVGPYSVDNVYIATGGDNMRDYWVRRRAASVGMEAAQ